MDKSFWKVGHRPTLYAAFLYFDLAFMVWVMLGPLGVQIAKDLGLTHAQKGMMVATRCSPARSCASSWACWSTT
jgi:NNP family nitrate/nitrite transporter-like MFS transporter